MELCGLGKELPLFDGASGAEVAPEQDRRIELLRDALMDAARGRVEELGEDAVSGLFQAQSDPLRASASLFELFFTALLLSGAL